MTSKGSKTRIKWEGNSQEEIRSWPKEIKEDIGLDLHRLDNHEEPLDSGSMAPALPGVRELRAEDESLWYRLLYWLHSGWIYVLHCFTKKTNEISKSDVDIAKDRMKAIKQRDDAPAGKEQKSA